MVYMGNIFYVYIHKCKHGEKAGHIFYVGKGKGNRSLSMHSRNPKWASFALKYGREIIHVQEGMSEGDAFLLEMWLIAKLRHEGVNLSNLTDGGDGVSGYRHTDETKGKLSRAVYCSNGMAFPSCKSAAEWCIVQGIRSAKGSHISACASKIKNSAYGHSWSHDGVPIAPKYHGKQAMGKSARALHRKVNNSGGYTFDSIKSAEIWLTDNGHPNASNSAITMCCKGTYKSAYGFSWWYDGDPEKTYVSREEQIGKSQGFPVLCSNGMVFDGMGQAARWLRDNGKPKADMTNIKKVVDGKLKTAYGFKWVLI